MVSESSQERVVIVGGGCAGVTSALELSHPKHEGRFDVTLYQIGWRLGGKGASSRGVHGRIEEHGLHLWLGFYENAFGLIRDCYTELDRDPSECPIATFEDAFAMDDWVSVTDRTYTGDWEVWTAQFPRTPGLPGDPLGSSNPFHFQNYIVQAFRLLRELLKSLSAPQEHSGRESLSDDPEGQLDDLLKFGQLASTAVLLEALTVASAIVSTGLRGNLEPVQALIQRVQEMAHNHLHTLILADAELRRLWTIADLVLTCLRGVFRFSLYSHPQGFDAINDYDWLDWLKQNGAHETTLDSAFVRGSCYDLTFAYEKGDPNRPAFAAGVALRCALRMFFTYRGAVFYKMSAGMGEIVFAPIYQVLKRRGVKVEFFHKLTNVGIAEDAEGAHVSSLSFDVQAETINQYEPLIMVKGLPCWPDRPLSDQLTTVPIDNLERQYSESVAFKLHLKVGDDFDFVVLAVSLGTIPDVCTEILANNEKWRLMTQHVKTVGTQAFQLWLDNDMAEFGVDMPGGNLSGFVTPFDTWADMTRVIAMENWDAQPQALAYFCSSFPDDMAEGSVAVDVVRENARRFLEQDIGSLWPNAHTNGHFRWECVPKDGVYVRANTEHSERYVQSLPGSVRHRISPLDRTYDNMTVAGDWTKNGIDAGCVEAAVISGRLAAHAISGLPHLNEIVGFDHP